MAGDTEVDVPQGEISEVGMLYGIGSWLATAGPILRAWMDGHEDRQADLKWLADGIDMASDRLLKIVNERAANDPFVEIFVGERPRH